jgi:hypothetical protein
VSVADLWPSICCILMSAPEAIASEAAVCLNLCGWKPGIPSSASALFSAARWNVFETALPRHAGQ